ncbi:hypothetical protein SAMD00023353_1101390 [Rosellinia necatrix]|uniref:Uncharacterized protein n=1 Tax=Rosellinia necatrix TaxID=77044 RepID=A0A1S7URS9_ROSNE|nr:hypothetical protein SAMD00023353_1101390 [Rosellinia necatrix]
MAGNNITALAAMMDDLGNHRIEELIDDEPRSRPALLFNTPGAAGSRHPRKKNAPLSELAKMYHAAIADGEFNDAESAEASGLDPLDNGNAHRLGRATRQPFEQLQSNQPHNTRGIPPRYNPIKPTYYQGTRSRKPAPNTDHRLSSLGGIIPNGGEAKRWDTGRPKTADSHIGGPIMNLPAGRGRAVHADGGFPLRAVHGQGLVDQDVSTQKLQQGAGRGRGKPTQPQQSSMNGSRPVNAATHKPGPPRPVSPPHARPEVFSKTIQSIASQTHEAGDSSNRATSRMLPHLRKASESPSTAAQVPPTSFQPLLQLSKATSEANASEKPPNFGAVVTPDAREVFFQGNILVADQCGGGGRLEGGRIIVYEPTNMPVGLWELKIENKKLSKGDIRQLLLVLTTGSTALLRRYDGIHPVRSTALQFPNIQEAKNFMEEVNVRIGQYAGSSEPIYTETTVELSLTQDTVGRTEPSQSSGTPTKKLDTPSLKLPRGGNSGLKDFGSEELIRVELATEDSQPKVEARPHTPPVFLPTAEEKSTLAGIRTENSIGIRPEESENDLISFSPDPISRSSRRGTLVGLDHKAPVTTQVFATVGVMNPGGTPPEKQSTTGGKKAQWNKSRTDAAVGATRALHDMKGIEGVSFANGQSGAFYLSQWNPVDYTVVIRMSKLLSIILGDCPMPRPDPAFVASLLHLVETDEFLNLPYDEQKKVLAALYTTVRSQNSRIIRSGQEISALRSYEESCPSAIKEFNAAINYRGHGHPERNPSTPELPTYSIEAMTKTMGADNASSYCTGRGNSPVNDSPQSTTITAPHQRGLAHSRWASDGPKKPKQPSATRGDETERIIDRNANSHRRTSTGDTISLLAEQLGSLSVNC